MTDLRSRIIYVLKHAFDLLFSNENINKGIFALFNLISFIYNIRIGTYVRFVVAK